VFNCWGIKHHLGRNPKKVEKGFGKNALEGFVQHIFEDKNIDSLTLTVFDSNIIAKKLYEKLGFKIDKVIECPNLKYIMKKLDSCYFQIFSTLVSF